MTKITRWNTENIPNQKGKVVVVTGSSSGIGYEAAREMVAKAGNVVGIYLRPHDLRRHAATYASRSGVPIEIVSKVILRHSNLSTTERYLGKITDVEAMKWIDTLYA